MGSQQLLFIVLGVILVGTAVVVGMNLYNAYEESQMNDLIIANVNDYLNDANKFLKTPAELGGGGNKTFKGWKLPKSLRKPDGDFVIKAYKVKGKKNKAQINIISEGRFSNNKQIRVYGMIWKSGKKRIMKYDSNKKKWAIIFKER